MRMSTKGNSAAFRRPRSILAAALTCFVMAIAAHAEAAVFTSKPPTLLGKGTTSISWGFKSSQAASGPYGWVAYKFSSDLYWTRCFQGTTLTLSNIPDGKHELLIADDVNTWNWSGRGLGSSSYVMSCYQTPPTAPFASGTSSSSVTIDTSPPAVPMPNIETSGLRVDFALSPSDALSDITSIRWDFGDASGISNNLTSVTHEYRSAGTFEGNVEVRDEAGNSATREFAVQVSAPQVSPPSKPDSPVGMTRKKAKSIAKMKLARKYGKSWSKGRRKSISCREFSIKFACKATWLYRQEPRNGLVNVSKWSR